MKRIYEKANIFVAIMLVGFTLGFASCSDDDDAKTLSPKVMIGAYEGYMITTAVAPENEDEAGEDPSGIKVSANVKDNAICINNLPIKDIVLSIVGDEDAAEQIAQNVGDVEYNIGYNPQVSADGESIVFAFDAEPEPLKMSMIFPSAIEGEEPQSIAIEVTIEANNSGIYYTADGNMKFELVATKVLVGTDEEMTEMGNFEATTFVFDLFQNRIYE
ncbi:MAG: DUF4840 domain-containing protein [Muribaculaceae bacterium]